MLIHAIKDIEEDKVEDDKMNEETVELTNEEVAYLKKIKTPRKNPRGRRTNIC